MSEPGPPTLACDNCGDPMLGERKHWGSILVCGECYAAKLTKLGVAGKFASMTPDQTPTPRTDAATKIVWGQHGTMVDIHFARDLERDLAAANARIASLNSRIAVLRTACEVALPCGLPPAIESQILATLAATITKEETK